MNIYAVLNLFSSLFLVLPRQPKGDSWHQDEAGGAILAAVVLSGPGEGAPEGGDGVCHFTQSWTIVREL